METWSVDRAIPVEPSGATYDTAYRLKLSYAEGAEQTEVLVEFEAVSSVASGGYAEEAIRPFLGDDELPKRLVVRRDGVVEATGAATERDADAPSRTRRRKDSELPQRARRRARG